MNFPEENHSYIFQYGPSCGTYRFRSHLAQFLSQKYQSTVESSDLVVSGGATSGLLLILSTLIDLANGVVFLDEVTYMIALESIKDFCTLKIVPVKLNEDGVDIKDLEQKIIKFKPTTNDIGKMFNICYYTIPTYHNPTGILFSDGVCKALITIARKYDMLIICDDVYNLLYYTETPPKRLFAYDDINDDDFKGHVISNGTFSKLLSPGTRIGWMECPPRIVEKFRNSGFLKSGGCIQNYVSGVITSMIELKTLDEQLELCKQNYKCQRDALVEALSENLPSECSFIKPSGGYFIWIKLPEYIDGEDLCDYILTNFKVFAIKGNRFSAENKNKNFMRLSFAFHNPETLKRAGKLTCEGIKKELFVNFKNLNLILTSIILRIEFRICKKSTKEMKQDNETGEMLIPQELVNNEKFDLETGEIEVAEIETDNCNEMINFRNRNILRKPKFNVPRSYLQQSEEDERSRCYLSSTESFSLTDKKRVIDLKEEIFLGYNKFSHRLFLIPSIFFFNKIGAIYVVLVELLLHIWAHKKNSRNKNPKIYYRSPLHSLTSHFCNYCRETKNLKELKRYYYHKQQKFMATSF
ncbi:hypothetical protein PVAND_007370 [Polypedilum vanderplanki]|uniref:Aminotransferase class I/classII large domain-containing protein n=1 Tax=Polypedilum vanderplanki TaxID=319348 RepID=A0A9J6C6S8_POLVA|nr:hypothetical protein PVAND_007370 [Polypedilum vanderplanki]